MLQAWKSKSTVDEEDHLYVVSAIYLLLVNRVKHFY